MASTPIVGRKVEGTTFVVRTAPSAPSPREWIASQQQRVAAESQGVAPKKATVEMTRKAAAPPAAEPPLPPQPPPATRPSSPPPLSVLDVAAVQPTPPQPPMAPLRAMPTTVSKASLSLLASRLQGVTTDRLLEISFGTAVDATSHEHARHVLHSHVDV